jgi:hypothetical protein
VNSFRGVPVHDAVIADFRGEVRHPRAARRRSAEAEIRLRIGIAEVEQPCETFRETP